MGFGMIDYKEVVRGIRIKNTIRLLTLGKSHLSKIIQSHTTNSLLKITLISPIREPIDSSIKHMRDAWKKFLTNNITTQNNDICEGGNTLATWFRRNSEDRN